MHAWEAIQNTVDYIEAHIKEDISAERLSEIAGLSPYFISEYFFKRHGKQNGPGIYKTAPPGPGDQQNWKKTNRGYWTLPWITGFPAMPISPEHSNPPTD